MTSQAYFDLHGYHRVEEILPVHGNLQGDLISLVQSDFAKDPSTSPPPNLFTDPEDLPWKDPPVRAPTPPIEFGSMYISPARERYRYSPARQLSPIYEEPFAPESNELAYVGVLLSLCVVYFMTRK